jgi:hypothetical protein
MARIVAITRIKDEIDIVEAFVRHSAELVDHHILIDNGSIDGTLDVLRRLHEDGLRISVFRNPVPILNTWHFAQILLKLAGRMQQADWVVPLDADEFLCLGGVAQPPSPPHGGGEGRGEVGDSTETHLTLPPLRAGPLPLPPEGRRGADPAQSAESGRAGLERILETVPAAEPGFMIRSYTYTPRSGDDRLEPNPVLRITHRWEPMPAVHKVVLRASPDWLPRLAVAAGYHAVALDGVRYPLQERLDLRLAHFYRRTVAQEAQKAVIGRLRAMSGPIENYEEQISTHYKLMFERVKEDPMLWLLGPSGDDSKPVVRDPIEYRGGPLCHTPPDDSPSRFVRVLIEHGELQAKALSALLRKFDPEGSELTRTMLQLERIV